MLALTGSREWRNRQTRTVQVRVPERVWEFNSPLAHRLYRPSPACELRQPNRAPRFKATRIGLSSSWTTSSLSYPVTMKLPPSLRIGVTS